MSQLPLSAVLIMCVLGGAAEATAEAPKPALVLVVESSEGLTGANQLRATLSKQFGVKVLALGDAALDTLQPGALMAIAADRTNAIRVVYVDVAGHRDTLRAPAPLRREDTPSVVQALASALLQRHLKDLGQPAAHDVPGNIDRTWLDEESRLSLAAFSRSLHAALGRIGYLRHRSGDLHRDDF